MRDFQAEQSQLILHNDDETPLEFVAGLLHAVFRKTPEDAARLVDAVDRYGKATCGVYPADIANELLETVQQRIQSSGHPLVITSEAVADGCKLCGASSKMNELTLKGMVTFICDGCIHEVTSELPEVTREKQFGYGFQALAWHFAGVPWDRLVATSRQFPGHMRADVQAAIDQLFSASPIRFFGIHEQYRYETRH
jgi:ATP-dependent Clp protease adapter protein ClpS